MKVLFAASECAPFVKSGGLGDVIGALPSVLNKYGADARVILPKYSTIPKEFTDRMKNIEFFEVELGWRKLYCGILELEHEGVHYYFVDNEYFFKRPELYGYDDDCERFAFFSKAILKFVKGSKTYTPDVIHCNDWHTGLIPLFKREIFGQNKKLEAIKTVFTIHNIKHQGIFNKYWFGDLLGLYGIEKAWKTLEMNGSINYMKAGIIKADRVTTVSPTYSKEITNSYYGEGLESVIASLDQEVTGILNGINYKHVDFDKGKTKAQLQEKMGFEIRDDVPLITMISRLTAQKGLDLVAHVMDELAMEDVQMIFLGSGEAHYENMLKHFESRYPKNVKSILSFDEELAEKLYMGADIFLMPSYFEPCGISQLLAMQYGTIPIARETGGLLDTVIPYNHYTGEGTGFSFSNINAHEFLFTIKRALDVYKNDKPAWRKLKRTAAATEFSWNKSAEEYMRLYESIT
ncbi:MAG: glycogen synthase GlgA [Peptostreptococcaceae bacterium]|nr:glycogen synthase GlgA [Peptostreptococcaceae bacterium]